MSASRSVAGWLENGLNKNRCGAWNTAAPLQDSTRVHCCEIRKATTKTSLELPDLKTDQVPRLRKKEIEGETKYGRSLGERWVKIDSGRSKGLLIETANSRVDMCCFFSRGRIVGFEER